MPDSVLPSSESDPEFAVTSLVLSFVVRVLLTFASALIVLLSAALIFVLFSFSAVPPLIIVGLLALDVVVIVLLLRRKRFAATVGGAVVTLIIVGALGFWLSQVYAFTPPITSPGGFASMEQVELNNSQQWITIRGENIDNPVLLFLAGGPGGSELVMTRKHIGALEAQFTIVNWDQPGTGKSYNAVSFADLTPERYIEDAHALVLYLRERFHQDKIYLMGESWGTILGVWVIQRYPDLFHAFIGTGQMVSALEDDIRGYNFAIELLTEQGKTEEADALRHNGAPPYTGGDMLYRYTSYLGVLSDYMFSHADGEGGHGNLIFDSLYASEYGLIDKVNWLLGLATTFGQVYPQIQDFDFRVDATRLDVPIYLVSGRWDVNAMLSLVEEWYAILEAPHKELIIFEQSGHTPQWEEPTHFMDVMINTVLAQTAPE